MQTNIQFFERMTHMPNGCEATFTVSYTQKNACLQILQNFSMAHNHSLSQDLSIHYPKHRKLDASQTETVTDYLQCHPTNAGLLHTVQTRFGKAWTLSDLKNFKQKGTVSSILCIIYLCPHFRFCVPCCCYIL